MKSESAAEVRMNREARRFELPLGNGEQAVINYKDAGAGVLALVHTEVPQGHKGQGVGSRLVEGALKIVQAENRKIVPTCAFVASYLRRHAEYRRLVA